MRRYGLSNFIFDIFMSAIESGGLWLIWIFVREKCEVLGEINNSLFLFSQFIF